MTDADPDRPAAPAPDGGGRASDRPAGDAAGPPASGRRPAWLRPRYWILVAALLVGAVSVEGSLDTDAQAATDRVFRQSLLTYAAARSLDAAISLAEGTEIALEPGGVGVTISAGEVLEPVDDLVEQFSSVMLVSATSLGLQSLLLRASAWRPLTFLLLAVLLVRVGVAFVPGRVPAGLARFISGATTVLLVARLAVPLYAVGTSYVFERYLQPEQERAVQALEETSADVRELDQLDEEEVEAGLVGRVSRWFSGAVERLDVSQRVEALRERVGEVVDQLMHLLVIFVLQTLVLPLVFLWILSRVLAAATSRSG